MANPTLATPQANASITEGDNYAANVLANFADTDVTDTLSYSVSAGAFPVGSGLSLDANSGIISGVPTAADVAAVPYVVTIQAEDSLSNSNSIAVTIDVTASSGFRNVRAEILFNTGTIDQNPVQDPDGVYRDFGTHFGYVKFGDPITITNITKANPAIATYSGDQPPANSGYTLDAIASGMTELSGRLIRPKNITATTFECWQDGDDTGYDTPFPGVLMGTQQTDATGYGTWSGSVSAQSYRRNDSLSEPHPYNMGVDRYPGTSIVAGTETPPSNSNGAADDVIALEGPNFLSHTIQYWVDHAIKEDGVTHGQGNKPRNQMIWADSDTALTNGETIWFGFSIFLPSNFHQDTQTNNLNFSTTQLMEIEDDPSVAQANVFMLRVAHLTADGANMMWKMDAILTGNSSGPSTDGINLGSIVDDIGLWTSFIVKLKSHASNGGLEVWKSVGAYTSGQRRKMSKVYTRTGQPVGFTPSGNLWKLGQKQYKFAYHQRSNTIDSIVQWMGFDSIRWGTEESDATDFADVHPFNETEAQTLL